MNKIVTKNSKVFKVHTKNCSNYQNSSKLFVTPYLLHTCSKIPHAHALVVRLLIFLMTNTHVPTHTNRGTC